MAKNTLPLVYVCSPYSRDIKNNVENAKRYSRFVVENYAIPLTPHLLYPQFMDDDNEKEREMAIYFDSVLLTKCSEIWVFGERISCGMRSEIALAKEYEIKIRWFTSDLQENIRKEI